VLVVCGVGFDAQASTAHANDCLAAPNASSPQGQHWYYRIERPSHRKCWYLRATQPSLHRLVIKQGPQRHRTSLAASVPMPESFEDNAPLSARLKILAAERQFDTIAEEQVQQSSLEANELSSIPPEMWRAARCAHREPDDARTVAVSNEPTGKAGLAGALRLIFLLLVPGLAIAGRRQWDEVLEVRIAGKTLFLPAGPGQKSGRSAILHQHPRRPAVITPMGWQSS
jgi:hypothetical protein